MIKRVSCTSNPRDFQRGKHQVLICLKLSWYKGDYIGLYNPGIQTERLTNSQREYADVILECASDTILFFMSEQEAELAQVSKVNNNSFYDMSDMFKSTSYGSHSRQLVDMNEIMARNEEGFMDCANYPKRIRMNELVRSMLNVTLFGRIVALGSNDPFVDPDGKTMDRYAMRIMDETGKVDVTLWEEVGRSARQWREGQYVLLSDLSTSTTHMSEKGPQWYVNGSVLCGTKVYNVSHITGLLTSSDFCQIKSIKACVSEVDHWQAEMAVVGWELHLRTNLEGPVLSDESDSFTNLDETAGQEVQDAKEVYDPFGHCTRRLGDAIVGSVHDACLRPIATLDTATDQKILSEQEEKYEKGRLVCGYCKCDITPNQVVQAFETKPNEPRMELLPDNSWRGWLEWRLDDGTGIMMASGCEEDIINIPALEFKKLSNDTQITYLDSALGKPFLCSVTRTSSGHRIDQAVPLQHHLGELTMPAKTPFLTDDMNINY
ncbi:hypothetical protein CLU79DRAFT_748806 [Phycomyces nitens]|nr:hypothetical protein CLU79DRAFT_748806 [Phycomyces nitens]